METIQKLCGASITSRGARVLDCLNFRRQSLHGDGLGQVPGAVHIAAPEHRQVVGEQLHGDDGEDALERVHRAGHLQVAVVVFGPSLGLGVAALADEDGAAVAGRDLLQRVHALGVDPVPHEDHDDGHSGVDEGERPVLQLSCLDPLAVHVRQLFHLERAFQAGGEVEAATHDQQGALLVQRLGNLQNLMLSNFNLKQL